MINCQRPMQAKRKPLKVKMGRIQRGQAEYSILCVEIIQ